MNPATEDNRRIFVSTNAYYNMQKLFAVDALTGKVLWNHDFGNISSVNPPACAKGSVYVVTGGHQDSFLYKFDGETGKEQFKSPYNNQWSRNYAPTLVEGNVFMSGGSYGGCYSFNASTGQQNWFTGLNQYDEWTPAVDGDLVYAYTGNNSPNVSVMNAKDGSVLYTIPDPGFSWDGWSMRLAPVLGDQKDLFATQGGRLIRFDLEQKNIAWTVKEGYVGQVSWAKGVLYVYH